MKVNRCVLIGKCALLALATAWATSSAQAATDTWLLPVGPNGVAKWSDSAGWSSGSVPAATDDAIIETGTACDENSGGYVNINNVTVQSGAKLQVYADNSGGIRSYNVFFVIGGTLENDSTVAVEGGGGAYSDLIFSSSGTSITGTGTLTLQNSASVLLSDATTPTLTVGANQIINGAGYISADLINKGTIDASYGGNPMVLLTNAYNYDNSITTTTTAYTNKGTMEATGGDSLQIGDGNAMTFNNTGGIINATGSAGSTGSQINIENGVTVTGGTLSSDGNQSTYRDYINTRGAVTLNGVSITPSSILNNSSTLALQGTITVNGDIENGGGISISGGRNVTLAGSGGLHMASAGSTLSTDSSSNLFNNATIHGLGQISGNITNSGTMNADTNNTLNFTTTPSDLTTTITNTGTLEATNPSGNLAFGYDANFSSSSVLTVNNTGGTISAAGGIVNFYYNTTVNGGTLSSSGSGELQVDSYTTTLNGVTISAGSTLATNGGALAANGTITNNGTILLAHGGQPLVFASSGDLSGSGKVAFSYYYGSGTISAANNAVVTVDAGQTIAGGAGGSITAPMVNNGVINTDSGGDFYLQSSTLTNNGTVAATNGTLHFNSGTFTNADVGTVQAAAGNTITADGGTVTNVSNGTLTGGTWIVDANASMNLGGGNITTNAATIILKGSGTSFNAISGLTSNSGTFKLENGATFNFSGDFTNSGTVVLDPSSMYVPGNMILTSSSILDIGLTGTGTGQYDTISANGSATLGGELVLNLESGFTANVGDKFTFLMASGISGSFTNTNSGPLNVDGYSFDFTPTADTLGLQVTAVPTPEPTTLVLLAAGGLVLLMRRRKKVES